MWDCFIISDQFLSVESCEELLYSVGSIFAKEHGRFILFYDNAVFHEDNVIGNISRERHFMSYDNHSHALCRKFLDYFQDLARKFGVECRSGFVKEKNIRVKRECARDRNALLLSARKFAGIGVRLGFIKKLLLL